MEGAGADSEIETRVEYTDGLLDRVILRDADGLPDNYVLGTSAAGGNDVNVNPGDPTPDVDGSAFGDVLRGTAAHEDLFGFGGDDLIEGRGGDDTLAGGDGVDTASYESAGAPSRSTSR